MTTRTAHYVAVILAASIGFALNIVVAGLVWASITDSEVWAKGIGENATQILTGWGGGVIGVLGAYVGYAFGQRGHHDS